MCFKLIVIGLVAFMAVGFAALYTQPKSDPRTPPCTSRDIPHTNRFRVLIIGDSWAGHREIGEGISKLAVGNNLAVTVCQIGYSGFTSFQILEALSKDQKLIERTKMRLGGAPDLVLVIDGINDVAGHRGQKNYVLSNVTIGDFVAGSTHTLYLEIPFFSEEKVNSGMLKTIGHRVRACLNDRCRWDVLQSYRASMTKAVGQEHIIPFSGFMESYSAGATSYVDGVHLSAKRYYDLGIYIGEWLAKNSYLRLGIPSRPRMALLESSYISRTA